MNRTSPALRTFHNVCVMLRTTGFGHALNAERIRVLRNWIAEGEHNVELLADAIVHY